MTGLLLGMFLQVMVHKHLVLAVTLRHELQGVRAMVGQTPTRQVMVYVEFGIKVSCRRSGACDGGRGEGGHFAKLTLKQLSQKCRHKKACRQQRYKIYGVDRLPQILPRRTRLI